MMDESRLDEIAREIVSGVTKTESELGTQYELTGDVVIGLREPYELALAYLRLRGWPFTTTH